MKKNTKLTLNEEIVLSCAFRYALGRMTYVVGSVAEELIRHEPLLGWDFKSLTAREIQAYQDEHGLAGHNIDNREWDYVKWLFTQDRRYIVEANKYKTDEWVEVEAVYGEDGVYYSLEGRNKHYHTVRNPVKKVFK